MRNKYFIILCTALLLGAGCTDQDDKTDNDRIALKTRTFPSADLPDIDREMELQEEGGEDNPGARQAFDVLRFRDPATGKIPAGIRGAEIAFANKLPVSDGFSYKNSQGRNITAELNFSAAGPVNVGGRTRALAIDVTNTNRIFAGGVSGGLWRSNDKGNSWTRVSPVTSLPNIRSIVQDVRAGHESTWFYGTGEIEPGSSASFPGAPYRGNGIYRSTDNGNTWTAVQTTGNVSALTSAFNYVHNLALDPSNSSQAELYAACLGGIYKTTNGFNSVSLVLGTDNFQSNSTWTEVAVSSTGVVYATLSSESNNNNGVSGIYRSETGEAGSWEDITPATGYGTSFRRIVIGISPSDEDVVYFLGNKRDTNVLHRYDASAPAGQQWTDLTDNIPMLGEPQGNFNAQSSYNMVVAVHPNDENIVFLGGTNLYRSTNGFSDETETDWIGGYTLNNNSNQYFNHHADQHSVAFFPDNPNEMLSSHDGGISHTTNNLKTSLTEVTDGSGNVIQEVRVVWESLNNAYITSQFYSVGIDEENVGDPTLLGGMQDNSTYIIQSDNRSSNWTDIGAGDGGYCYYDLTSVIVSAQYSNIFRYGLVNDEFQAFNISPPNAGDDELNLFVNPILLDPVAPNKAFVGAQGRVYYTLNIRQNPSEDDWLTFGNGTLPNNQRVSAMGASIEPQGVLYMGTEGGRLYRVNNSTRLDDIEDVTGSLPSGYISCVMVDPTNANRVLVSYSNYNMQSIYYTTNGGDTWSTVAGNLENGGVTSVGAPSVRWLAYVPNGATPLYLAGTSAGLFSTSNLNGNSTVWAREGAGTIGVSPVDMIRVRPIDGTVVVATHGSGIFEARADVAFTARLQVMDLLCEEGEVTLQTNIQLQGVEDEYDLTYEWFADGQPVSNVTGPGIITTSEAIFTVRVTNAVTGESDMSNPVEVRFGENSIAWCNEGVTSAEDDLADQGIAVYPNPTSGPLTIKTEPGKFNFMTITDLKGAVIMERSISTEETISLEDQPDGVYIIEFSGERDKISRRIIKISEG